MTQEEKAKAYDEALEKAKAAIDMAADKDLVGGVVKTILPELRESEDEKNWKSVERAVRGFITNPIDADELLAWLEKQKEQDPIKVKVYEVGKGTTICGQDYKCKKDYKVGNCQYIKDAIYHCGRDGYLTDQNGVSWSCTPEWFKEYIQSNTEWAEEEKTRFVSGQFLQCKLSFDEFKEDEHYWLEYIGDDMYVGRSDNILNQKFHITPRQLYTLFSQQLEEVQGPPQEEKQVSLNYEPPFNENPSDREIIDALIHSLKEQDGFLTAINCVSTKAILSWLEKQKEYPHPTNKEMLRILRTEYEKGVADTIAKYEQKEQKSIDLSEMMVHKEPYIAPVPTPIVADEQKSAECEDCAMYLSGNCTHPNGKCENVKSKQEWSDEDKEALDMCLDAIPKRWKTKSGILLTKWLKDNIHLQLKQEWSEDYREEDIQTRFAFYTYKDDLGTLYLSNVFVEEASRNHGFGTRILIAAEKVAETIGATTISLKVKQDSPANAWYRKNGYGYVAFEDGYDWLEKNLEYMKPNKQEWSEEDEKMIETICKEGDLKPSEQHWLKSLRPQYHGDVTMTEAYKMGLEAGKASSWKPSEKQTNNVIVELTRVELGDIINGLYYLKEKYYEDCKEHNGTATVGLSDEFKFYFKRFNEVLDLYARLHELEKEKYGTTTDGYYYE